MFAPAGQLMNVSTVFAHPGSQSFCHAVLDRFDAVTLRARTTWAEFEKEARLLREAGTAEG